MNIHVNRIIDANINRLMEGLRVVEDVSRFMLEDKQLSLKIKNIRSKVKDASKQIELINSNLITARDSSKDVGRQQYTVSESSRPDVEQIVTSNIKRAEEASRVLEEFGKLTGPAIGKQFKAIRYELYEIEKELGGRVQGSVRKNKLDFDLYVVTDPDVLNGRSPVSASKEAIKGGAKIIQLRDKKTSIGQYYSWAKEISGICKKNGVKFIVNDYADICVEVDADGLHLGQDDVPVSVARKIVGHDRIIGLSTHSYEQALKGAKSGADYISVGPVFTTASKPNTVPVGLELVKRVANSVKIPFVAIGGINEKNIADVIKAGAIKAAVIRAAIDQRDIAGAVRKLRKYWK